MKGYILCLVLLFSSMAAQAQNPTTVHVIKRGETAESIAAKYGIHADDLKAANPNVKRFYAGAKLVVPTRSGESTKIAGHDHSEKQINEHKGPVSENKNKDKNQSASDAKALKEKERKAREEALKRAKEKEKKEIEDAKKLMNEDRLRPAMARPPVNENVQIKADTVKLRIK